MSVNSVNSVRNVTLRTAVSNVQGDKGKLEYRGISIGDLCEHSTYEEVIYLTMYGELPSDEKLKQFKAELGRLSILEENRLYDEDKQQTLKEQGYLDREIPLKNKLINVLSGFEPKNNPTDMMAALTSVLESNDKLVKNDDIGFEISQMRVAALMPTLLALVDAKAAGKDLSDFHFPEPKDYGKDYEDYTIAGSTLAMLHGFDSKMATNDIAVNAFDKQLILHVTHGRGNNSELASVIVSSAHVEGGIWTTVNTVINSLAGELHGNAANKSEEQARSILASGEGTAEEKANAWFDKIEESHKAYYDARNGGAEVIPEKRMVFGLGHRVYTENDPRSIAEDGVIEKLLEEIGPDNPEVVDLYTVVKTIAERAAESSYFGKKPGKPIYPNVDLKAFIIDLAVGLGPTSKTARFCTARAVGALACVDEHMQEVGAIERAQVAYTGKTGLDYKTQKDIANIPRPVIVEGPVAVQLQNAREGR